uniref:Inorganic pyrophosphatase n=1 Tax=Caligus rogercresseyi TaxID=217165 RepID=C1BRD0_CALRO|nr:Inorganic pyrophosphatase [Caligus rogercresseyi]
MRSLSLRSLTALGSRSLCTPSSGHSWIRSLLLLPRSMAVHTSHTGHPSISTLPRGSEHTPDFRIYFRNEKGQFISPFHDVPMIHDPSKNIFNAAIEVPKWTNAKMEISLKDELNPIRQDIKKGKLRYVANCFPYKGYIWNYGFIPQTWEDPEHVDPSTHCKGDGDPIDLCEIGQQVHPRGSIVQTKILGTLALVDEGETDWKILAIDVEDPLSEVLHDIEDIQKYMPGFIEATVDWFRIYKIPDGKPPNVFAFDGKPRDRAFALNILSELHHQWKSLMNRSDEKVPDSISRACTSLSGSVDSSLIFKQELASQVVDSREPHDPPREALSSVIDKWHFVGDRH